LEPDREGKKPAGDPEGLSGVWEEGPRVEVDERRDGDATCADQTSPFSTDPPAEEKGHKYNERVVEGAKTDGEKTASKEDMDECSGEDQRIAECSEGDLEGFSLCQVED
jgi:hypothetical protein